MTTAIIKTSVKTGVPIPKKKVRELYVNIGR